MEQVILLVVISMWIGGYLQTKVEEGNNIILTFLFLLYSGTFLYIVVKGIVAVLR